MSRVGIDNFKWFTYTLESIISDLVVTLVFRNLCVCYNGVCWNAKQLLFGPAKVFFSKSTFLSTNGFADTEMYMLNMIYII